MMLIATQTEMTQLAELLLKKYIAANNNGQLCPCCNGTSNTTSSTTVGTQVKSPIRIVSTDFVDATHWEGQNADGVTILPAYELEIFADDINQRFLTKNSDWVRTPTGFNIIAPWFDAITNAYILYVFISNPAV